MQKIEVPIVDQCGRTKFDRQLSRAQAVAAKATKTVALAATARIHDRECTVA